MQTIAMKSTASACMLSAQASSAAKALTRTPVPAATAAFRASRSTLRAPGAALVARRHTAHRMQAAGGDNPLASAGFDGVFTEEDLANLSDTDKKRIDDLVATTMEKIKDDPAAKEAFQQMVAKVQEEQTQDPEGFNEKMKQAQEMQMLQMKTFIYEVMKLSENDPEVGYVVKDLKENGEKAFEKYTVDQALLARLQTKCMVKAITDQVKKIDYSDPALGAVRTKLDEEGDMYAEEIMKDPTIMTALTKRAVLDDQYSLHGATRVGDLETMNYIISSGRDVNAPGPEDLNGASALHIAACANLVEPAKILLEHGAVIDQASPSTQGNSPLHFAVGYGAAKMVEFLIAKGANKNVTNANGQFPADMAELLQDPNMKNAVLAALN